MGIFHAQRWISRLKTVVFRVKWVNPWVGVSFFGWSSHEFPPCYDPTRACLPTCSLWVDLEGIPVKILLANLPMATSWFYSGLQLLQPTGILSPSTGFPKKKKYLVTLCNYSKPMGKKTPTIVNVTSTWVDFPVCYGMVDPSPFRWNSSGPKVRWSSLVERQGCETFNFKRT